MAGPRNKPYADAGRLLRARRKATWRERPQFAAAAGVPAPLYGNWEDGYRRPRPEQFYRVAALLFDKHAEALECAAAFGITPDERLWDEEVQRRGEGGRQPTAPSRSASGMLRGSAVKALLSNYRGTIRRGLPLPPPDAVPDVLRAPWVIEKTNGTADIDPNVLRTVSDGLSLALRPKELEHDSRRVKLADMDVYLVGDESFAEYNCHGDTLLVVCPGCYSHDGRLLIAHDRKPYLIPHFKNRSAPDVAELLGSRFAGFRPVGAVLATVKYREQSINQQPLFLSKDDPLLPRFGSADGSESGMQPALLRVGVSPWPDALLLAFDALRGGVDGALERIEFVVRESFDQLRADFRAGVLDMLVGPPELWRPLQQFAGASPLIGEPSLLYNYIGNSLYGRADRGFDHLEDRATLYAGGDDHELPPLAGAKKLLSGKTVATYRANDDHYLLVRFLRAVIENKADLLGAPDVDFNSACREVEAAIGVKIEALEAREQPSADFLWWAVTVPPTRYLRDPITIVREGASPITAAHVVARANLECGAAITALRKSLSSRPTPANDPDTFVRYKADARQFLNLRMADRLPDNFGRVIDAIRAVENEKKSLDVVDAASRRSRAGRSRR